MSRKNRKPIYTLSQDEAERLVAEVKNSVEKLFVMPAAGERNADLSIASAVRFLSRNRRRISAQKPITRFMYRYSSLTGSSL